MLPHQRQAGLGERLADFVWLLASAVREARAATALWSAIALGQGLLVPTQLWLTRVLVDALVAEVSRTQGSTGPDAAAGFTEAAPFLWLGLLAVSLLAQRVLDE